MRGTGKSGRIGKKVKLNKALTKLQEQHRDKKQIREKTLIKKTQKKANDVEETENTEDNNKVVEFKKSRFFDGIEENTKVLLIGEGKLPEACAVRC